MMLEERLSYEAIHFDLEKFSCTYFRCHFDEHNEMVYSKNININVWDFIKIKDKTYIVNRINRNKDYMIMKVIEVRMNRDEVRWYYGL